MRRSGAETAAAGYSSTVEYAATPIPRGLKGIAHSLGELSSEIGAAIRCEKADQVRGLSWMLDEI